MAKALKALILADSFNERYSLCLLPRQRQESTAWSCPWTSWKFVRQSKWNGCTHSHQGTYELINNVNSNQTFLNQIETNTLKFIQSWVLKYIVCFFHLFWINYNSFLHNSFSATLSHREHEWSDRLLLHWSSGWVGWWLCCKVSHHHKSIGFVREIGPHHVCDCPLKPQTTHLKWLATETLKQHSVQQRETQKCLVKMDLLKRGAGGMGGVEL